MIYSRKGCVDHLVRLAVGAKQDVVTGCVPVRMGRMET